MLFADIYYSDNGVVRDPSTSPMYECTNAYFSEHIMTTQKGSSVAGILEHGSIFGDRQKGIDIFVIPYFKDAINEAIDNQQNCLQNGVVWEPDWPGDEIDTVVQRYPLDGGDLRKSVYQYVRTRIHGNYREVFRILKAAVEKEEFQRRMECQ